MSLSTSLADLYRRLKYDITPSAAVTTRLTSGLNKAQQAVLGEIGGGRLTHGTITFPSITAQSEYGLPASVARILSIRDPSHRLRLTEIGEDEYRSWLADPTSDTGTPTAYCRLGIGFVALRPTASAPIVAVSTSAGDTTQTVFAVVDDSGKVVTVSATLTGLTAVSLAVAAIEVTDFYLSAVTAGNIELHQTNGAGLTLATIFNGHLRERYQRIALIPTPSSAVTYTVECERDAFDLVNATDDFPVPVRFADCVVERTLMYEYADAGDVNRYGIASKEYGRLLGLLNDYLVNPPDRVYVPGRPMAVPSNLPANFPTSVFRWP